MNNNSGLNTLLLVLIAIGLVAAGVWYFSNAAPQEEDKASIEITLPGDGGEEE